MYRDLHTAPKTEIIESIHGRETDLALVKLQYDKNDYIFGLHIAPNKFGLSGFQLTDFLSLLKFERKKCIFVKNN